MPRKNNGARRSHARTAGKRLARIKPQVSLQALAQHLKLSPATVSVVINDSPVAKSIPEVTKARIMKAAQELNYLPNFFARSLAKQRSFTIGVLVPEISEGYAATVLSGIEDYLLKKGFFYFVASHHHRHALIERYIHMLTHRGVDAVIAVDTPLLHQLDVPVVTVSGHRRIKGVTNILLDHERAAGMALQHLYGLGHRNIAIIKGQSFSSDTKVRWDSIRATAQKLGLSIPAASVVSLEGESSSPEIGYTATAKLLARKKPFTALFTFNDVSAIGAINALRDAGLSVPEDVSVVGFDDIQSAAFQNPRLTTVRQPLRKMGELAAEVALERLRAKAGAASPSSMAVEPELIVRESTTTCVRMKELAATQRVR
jgi:DNA-binding LacI/PurR family transcriptional regulator